MQDTARIAAVADKVEIQELLYRYCRGLDRVDIECMKATFHPDAILNYGVFEGNPQQYGEWALQFLHSVGPTQHNITNAVIELDGDKATCECYVIIAQGDESAGDAVDVIVYGRYLDRFERRNGVWKISYRQILIDWHQNLPRTANWSEGMGAAMVRGARDKTDPSYTFLR